MIVFAALFTHNLLGCFFNKTATLEKMGSGIVFAPLVTIFNLFFNKTATLEETGSVI